MRRSLFVTLLVIALLGLVVQQAVAYPPCGSTQPQTPSSFCRPAFLGNERVRISSGVPFVWVRINPSSDSGIVATVQPAPSPRLILAPDEGGRNQTWDGYQWWWHVRMYPGPSDTHGWVEQSSLVVVPQQAPVTFPPDQAAPWQPPLGAGIKPGVPFVWLRALPNSQGDIIVTVLPGQTFTLIAQNPFFDGVQWWWQVEYNAANRSWLGWVEQSSIALRL